MAATNYTAMIGNRPGYESPLTPKVCALPTTSSSRGIWLGLDYPFPIIMMQISLISIITLALRLMLKPLGQPPIVSQVLGGIILGPTILGHSKKYTDKVFPFQAKVVLDTFSLFGLMLFMFLIGVKMDISTALKSGRRSLLIAVFGLFLPIVWGSAVAYLLSRYMAVDPEFSIVLQATATVHSQSTFPVIASFLSELNILNSEIGHLATNAAIISDLCIFFIQVSNNAYYVSINTSYRNTVGNFISVSILIIILVFVLRPVALWINRQTPEGQPVKESHIFGIIAAVLGLGFIGQVIGQSYYQAPFLVGLVIPDGPPLGAALEERLQDFISVMFLPIFFTVCGLKVNVFAIAKKLREAFIIQIVLIFAVLAKTIGIMLPSLHSRMPFREAFTLALIMNSKGIIELCVYSEMFEAKMLDNQAFSILLMTVMITSGIIAPPVRSLYDPSRRYLTFKRNTIQHNGRNNELSILTCVHSPDDIPTIIKLLETSHPSNESPIKVCVLQLVELVGRSSSLFVDHRRQTEFSSQHTSTILKAFKYFEQTNKDSVSIHAFTSICPLATIHDDVCTLALEKKVALIIMPFHKQWLRGRTVQSSTAIRNLNCNVLGKAPCSVGILIDHNQLGRYRSLGNRKMMFSIAVLFFGGLDDQEALAYAERMAAGPNTKLRVIRLCMDGADNPFDTEMLNEFKINVSHNERVAYQEKKIRDGTRIMKILRSMNDAYDLVIVGRRHEDSALTYGLTEWSEFPELGIIGDILAAPDFEGVSFILVVQTRALVWGMPEQK
ncbi:hypothetical protein GIB67_007819 [Kingdonia uniflora]|uniref:Cation/H+ exchanger domain-containing protein n=1 Tax=Kingdonia uniflora TaxID=39325 RepID=A0A7J7N2M9_9MAGN|nr:hypothetical protein GIB67_007819 [Kingdonia uniflora]